MRGELSPQELSERVSLIEAMVGEGRRTTESWGWIFVLWGVAYFVALAWWLERPSAWTWPVTMLAAGILSAVYGVRKAGRNPRTTLGRAVSSIWGAVAATLYVVLFDLGFAGRLTDMHVFLALIAGMLGAANGASGLMLRWKLQMGCALAWWATAAAVCFTSGNTSFVIFLLAVLLCNIVFGFYGIFAQAKQRGRRDPLHA